MIQVHANTYRNIIKKAGREMSGFGWHNKQDRILNYTARFRFVPNVKDWRDRRNELKDGYVQFVGDVFKKREAEALLRLWLVENGYKYELILDSEDDVQGIRITHIPSQVERSA